MKHIGIIAEYNPFHNGHQYQIKKAKELFPDKHIFIVMSGDYVQRGEPAVYNKYFRTQAALSEGADVILELPSLFATASAEHFAAASVLALAATGMVDTLCFGAETNNMDALKKLADLFVTEPEPYQQQLKQYLKEGFSYPKARSLAAFAYLQDDLYSDILEHPNNILGIEYLKAIQTYHLDIQPMIIKRRGNGYHDLSIDNAFCSASAIRKTLHDLQTPSNHSMPASSIMLLQKSPYAKPLFLSDFYPQLQYALWQNKSYNDYFEISQELSNTLQNLQSYPSSITELIDLLSNKNLTNTRIQRTLLNILLNRKKTDMISAKETGYISYLRLLGFRNDASFLLKEMKSCCMVPVINKVANASKLLNQKDYSRFLHDIHCSYLYRQIFINKYQLIPPTEYEHTVIIKK